MTEDEFKDYVHMCVWETVRIFNPWYLGPQKSEWTLPRIKEVTPDELPSEMENGIL